MSEAPIYLDYAASTPVDPVVAEVMGAVLREPLGWANAASEHAAGRAMAARLDEARETVASLIGGDPGGIHWTSGATESDNLAILGGARAQHGRGRGHRVITVATEHAAVLAPCRQLESEGFALTVLTPEPDGFLPPQRLAEVMDDDVALVSVMHVNNETGVIQDLDALGEIVRPYRAVFHVDAAQSAGRLAIDVERWHADLVSLSAHKLYGPKGVGALWVRRRPRARLRPLLVGGGHEGGIRSGTVATHQVLGMAEAYRLAAARLDDDHREMGVLRARLWSGLAVLGGIVLNGRTDGAPHILNVSVAGVHGEALRTALSARLVLSAGSACASGQGASHVLRAMGRPEALASASLRMSLGRGLREQDVDTAVETISREVTRLRILSPVWAEIQGGASIASLYEAVAAPEVA